MAHISQLLTSFGRQRAHRWMEMMGKVLRSARTCLDLPAESVAKAAKIGLRTLGRLEAGDTKISFAAFSDVRRALEGEGITFVQESKDHGPGFLTPAPGFLGPLQKKQQELRKKARNRKRSKRPVEGQRDGREHQSSEDGSGASSQAATGLSTEK